MYESVDVVGLNPSPNPFLMMEYYNQSRGCLIPEKGLVPGAPHPYSTSIRNQHWNGSNHCRCLFLSSQLHSKTSIYMYLKSMGGVIVLIISKYVNWLQSPPWSLYPCVSRPVLPQLFKPVNMYPKRCVCSPSLSFVNCIIYTWPTFIYVLLPLCAPWLGMLFFFFFFPRNLGETAALWTRPRYQKLLDFLKYALDTNKGLRAMPPLIRSDCCASCILLLLW